MLFKSSETFELNCLTNNYQLPSMKDIRFLIEVTSIQPKLKNTLKTEFVLKMDNKNYKKITYLNGSFN